MPVCVWKGKDMSESSSSPRVVYYNNLECHLLEESVDGNPEKVRLKGTGDTWCKGGFVTLRRRVVFPDESSQHVVSESEYRTQLKEKSVDELKAMLPPAVVGRYTHMAGALLRMQLTNALCNLRRRGDPDEA